MNVCIQTGPSLMALFFHLFFILSLRASDRCQLLQVLCDEGAIELVYAEAGVAIRIQAGSFKCRQGKKAPLPKGGWHGSAAIHDRGIFPTMTNRKPSEAGFGLSSENRADGQGRRASAPFRPYCPVFTTATWAATADTYPRKQRPPCGPRVPGKTIQTAARSPGQSHPHTRASAAGRPASA